MTMKVGDVAPPASGQETDSLPVDATQRGLQGGDLLEVGVVCKAHGLKGGVKVKTHDPASSSLLQVESVLVMQGSQTRALKVLEARRDRRWFLVFFHGIKTRTQAQALQGATIAVLREQLEPLEDHEFYLADCMGAAVYDVDGQPLGCIAGVTEVGGRALLEIEVGRKQYIVPPCPPFIVDVCLEDRKVVVEIPAGLPATKLEK